MRARTAELGANANTELQDPALPIALARCFLGTKTLYGMGKNDI